MQKRAYQLHRTLALLAPVRQAVETIEKIYGDSRKRIRFGILLISINCGATDGQIQTLQLRPTGYDPHFA